MKIIFLILITVYSFEVFSSNENLPNCPQYGSHPKCIKTFGGSYGGKYIGSVTNGQSNGYGVFIGKRGEKYDGYWIDGLRSRGKQTFSDGGIYDGDWGRKYPSQYGMHGMGIYFYPNGESFEGLFSKNKPIAGTLVKKDGSNLTLAYSWNWEKFKGGRILFGTLTYPDGTTYEGEFDKYNNPKDTKLSPSNDGKSDNKSQSQSNDIRPVASGTGFAINEEGSIITNNHVVDGCEAVKVHHKGETYTSTMIAKDVINDLAIIKVDFKPNYFFTLKEQDPSILDEIVVAGYPFGMQISSNVKVTKGIVSSLAGIGNNYSQIQIDAALQPGNSGGPIIDLEGNLVGVAVSKLDLMTIVEDYGVVPEDTNFGIKSNVVKNLLLGNSVNFSSSKDYRSNKTDLVEKINESTFFLSCWMSQENIKKYGDTKVMFKNP